MAVSMPIPCMAANAYPAPSALSHRGTCLRTPSKSLHSFRNHLHQQVTFHRNHVGFRKDLRAFSSLSKLSESTIFVWDAALAQEEMAAPASDSPSEPLFISILLIAAFIGLSLVSIGVVYLGVTEFLEKREREKLLKEEEAQAEAEAKAKAKAKGRGRGKRKGKGIILAKSGPGGFGQKVDEDD